MLRKLVVSRQVALIVVVTAIIIAIEVFSAPRVQASGNATGTVHIVIGANNYTIAWGKSIVLSTRLPDGSEGWIHYRPDLVVATPEYDAGQVASGDPCTTVSGTEQWTDKAGFNLASYTLYQYWCYDFTNITSYTNAYKSTLSYLGWTLANHSESTTVTPPNEGLGSGKYRFNGPLGIGCVSGAIDIYFGGAGGSSVFKYYNGYYGC